MSDRWWEFESQDNYPNQSKAVFFRNQEKLKDLQVLKDLDGALEGIQALVLAVRMNSISTRSRRDRREGWAAHRRHRLLRHPR